MGRGCPELGLLMVAWRWRRALEVSKARWGESGRRQPAAGLLPDPFSHRARHFSGRTFFWNGAESPVAVVPGWSATAMTWSRLISFAMFLVAASKSVSEQVSKFI